MECTKDEGTAQQAEPSASADDQATAGAGAGDLLSCLCDDVLVRILGLTKHASDAVRTGALSRRWRGLWRRAPALRFTSGRWLKDGRSAHGFIGFVDDTLALHHVRSSDGGGLEQLMICLDMYDDACRNQQLAPPSIEAAERWILYAVRHGVKSFYFELYLPDEWDEEGISQETPVLALDGLCSSAKLEAMYLDLNDAWVRLPATVVVFASLTDLTLEGIKVAGDNVQLLARLVSSACCPRLQKLRMCYVSLARQQNLLLESGVLTELSLDEVEGMRSLELKTPSLRVLNIQDCDQLESLAASAPRLENLACRLNHLVIIDGDFPSVSRLKLPFYSHGYA
ncbi:unnamed protein product [Urochloa humidicola]